MQDMKATLSDGRAWRVHRQGSVCRVASPPGMSSSSGLMGTSPGCWLDTRSGFLSRSGSPRMQSVEAADPAGALCQHRLSPTPAFPWRTPLPAGALDSNFLINLNFLP